MKVHTNSSPRADGRAFTLVEVLIATIILGLGLLGLSALFAGAARQQQVSAELSRAVVFAQNAESFLRPKIGTLVKKNASTNSPIPGVWDALQTNPTDHILESTFALTPGGAGMYFEASGAQATYVSADVITPPGPVFIYATPFVAGSATGKLFDPPLPHGRVLPDSRLSVRVFWGAAGSAPGPTPSVVFSPDLLEPAINNWLVNGGDPPATVYLYENGVNPDSTNWAPSPGGPVNYVKFFTAQQDGEKARIEEISLGAAWTPGTDVLKSVSVNAYVWRNNQVVSINDRLLYEPDETFPGDRRPITGYSVLYRLRPPPSTGAEAAIITYALRPLTVPSLQDDEFQFIPPETQQSYSNDSAILREVEAILAYDRDLNAYVLAPEDSDDAWITQPGQTLLMSSVAGVSAVTSSTPLAELGADAPVRVLTRRLIDGAKVGKAGGRLNVAVLDDSPRVNRNSPLPSRITASPVTIFVWGVQPIVKSLGPDQTEWRVTPIDVRIFNFLVQ